ncbi:hypothetical protein Q9S36_49160 [Microbacterium sp. ARD31]|nr:hypothetical protein [Microbacterium sp. ARD31]MDT0188186.1 hypothetical protein [Microbacterium sp. ARD31]
MSDAAGVILALAAENMDLRQQLAHAQDLLVESIVLVVRPFTVGRTGP